MMVLSPLMNKLNNAINGITGKCLGNLLNQGLNSPIQFLITLNWIQLRMINGFCFSDRAVLRLCFMEVYLKEVLHDHH